MNFFQVRGSLKTSGENIAGSKDKASFSEYLGHFEGQAVAKAFTNLGGTSEKS